MSACLNDFPKTCECIYTSHYCEENVWKLCEKLKDMNSDCLEKCFCVFVSNNAKFTPLWFQKAGSGEDFFVAWDYHVFLVRKTDAVSLVYDFDSTLGFPTTFHEYLRKGIGSEKEMLPTYHRLFRVIPAKEYLKIFASDRRHMKNSKGEWLKPPPPYEPIKTSNSVHNLEEFISMRSDQGCGQVMDLDGFIEFFNNQLQIDFDTESESDEQMVCERYCRLP